MSMVVLPPSTKSTLTVSFGLKTTLLIVCESVFTYELKSTIADASPFTVLTNSLLAFNVNELLLMISTPVPVIPSTVVVNVFTVLVFDTVVAGTKVDLSIHSTAPVASVTNTWSLPPEAISSVNIVPFTMFSV